MAGYTSLRFNYRWIPVFITIIFAIKLATAQDESFPYKFNTIDWYMAPIGIGLDFLGESLIDNQKPFLIDEINALHHNDVNWFDRPATYNWSAAWDNRSDNFRDILIASSAFVFLPQALNTEWGNMLTMGVMYLETYYLTKGITALTKGLSARKRPYIYNESLNVEKRYRIASEFWGDSQGSFFSGHAAQSFAIAVFLSKVYSDYYPDSYWTDLIWGSSLTIASLTGYARYKSGEHYLSDVIVGAIVGGVIGYAIPSLHKKNRDDQFGVSISPFSVGFYRSF